MSDKPTKNDVIEQISAAEQQAEKIGVMGETMAQKSRMIRDMAEPAKKWIGGLSDADFEIVQTGPFFDSWRDVPAPVHTLVRLAQRQ